MLTGGKPTDNMQRKQQSLRWHGGRSLLHLYHFFSLFSAPELSFSPLLLLFPPLPSAFSRSSLPPRPCGPGEPEFDSPRSTGLAPETAERGGASAQQTSLRLEEAQSHLTPAIPPTNLSANLRPGLQPADGTGTNRLPSSPAVTLSSRLHTPSLPMPPPVQILQPFPSTPRGQGQPH
ncbi:unnamed protein product [Pleuronectes platessa]|uniref:Uncharacterized protein n=1 Tax=Pleuronectes platessa TaxID=8262 RepID=A0A9N7V9H2_PLEPL|nr:unnamed protein product [Pleuronectes platessa]